MTHANSILETFEYFCQITSKSIVTILSYTISKWAVFETQCRLYVDELLVIHKLVWNICWILLI